MPPASAPRLQSVVASDGAGNPSTEKSRRKGKWATERQEVPIEDEGKNRRRLQDPVPLEDNPVDEGNNRTTTRPLKRARLDAPNAVNPEYVPRSGNFFEHDDRSRRMRAAPSRRFGLSAERDERGHMQKLEERPEGVGNRNEGNDRWKHDRFLEVEKNKAGKISPTRGRIFENAKSGRKAGFVRVNGRGRGRWGERDERNHRNLLRVRGPVYPRGSKEQQGEWTHDLFDQRDKSPTAKREEASVAKLEALLAT